MPVRPCHARHPDPAATAADCRLCKLWETEPRYRELWGGDPSEIAGWIAPATPKTKVRFCAARNVWDWSVTLGGRTLGNGSEATEQAAQSEANAIAAAHVEANAFTPAKRHLLYHVWPVTGNGVWQRNLDMLSTRLSLFDGRRIIAIATGPGTDPPDAVREHLRDYTCEFLEVSNSPALREVVTWRPLWEALATSAGQDDVVFYAHAKGVTRPVNPGVTVHEWARIAYAANLDYWPIVRDLLTRHPVAGAFTKVGHGFQGSRSAWHFSGSFFWSRFAAAYQHVRTIDGRWWGTEAWPGLHFRPEEAGTIFQAGRVPSLDLYSPDILFGQIVPEFRKWCTAHAKQRSETCSV